MIGRQYLAISLFWAILGGLSVLLMRWQLAWPGTPVPSSALLSDTFWDGESWLARSLVHGIIEPEFYNKLFTMHGTIMVFFVAMPLLLGAFGNFLVPLMIGARDMAFPRLNMLSVWTLAVASIILLVSFFVPGGAASSGWTAYPPLSAIPAYTDADWGQNLWLLAIALEFASFLLGGVDLLTTVANLRAPGLSLFRLPLMVWFQGIAAVLFLLSVGPLIAGAVMLLLDRTAGTGFFVPALGDEPLCRAARSVSLPPCCSPWAFWRSFCSGASQVRALAHLCAGSGATGALRHFVAGTVSRDCLPLISDTSMRGRTSGVRGPGRIHAGAGKQGCRRLGPPSVEAALRGPRQFAGVALHAAEQRRQAAQAQR